MAVSAGLLIYSGFMPLIKTFAALICGYVLARMDMFPPAASRGASIISMNVALPALIFANIVPSFTPSNISALGPIILMASIYMISGFLMGIVIREVCYVPRNFWQGIVIMTGMSNWGNLPNAVVMSVTQRSPFNPATDPALGVSYVSIFSVCYHITFWVLGAAHSLSWDYLSDVPQGEEAERHVSWKEKPIGRLIARYILRLPITPPPPLTIDYVRKDEESYSEKETKVESVETPEAPAEERPKVIVSEEPISDSDIQLARRTSRLSAVSTFRSRRLSDSALSSSIRVTVPQSPLRVTIPASSLRAPAPSTPLRAGPPQNSPLRVVSVPSPIQPTLSDSSTVVVKGADPVQSKARHWLSVVFSPLSALLTPVTLAIAVALPIALIQPLKALFVDVSDQGGPNWHGPDGRPPLVFVMDTAQFIDTIAVPLALILLGASFARIKVPRPLARLPIMAMLLVTMAKMVLLPVMGVFIVQAMVRNGFIPASAKAEKFVAMLLSGTPAAVK
ncbi:auxin efflux carrier [Trametes meyenii]|nr:auxin efflux carrier [Trametes meyenii]